MAELDILRPEPLTAEAFAAFGDVMEAGAQAASRTINEGYALRFADLARLDLDREGGGPQIDIYRVRPKPLPLLLETMEHHPLSSQAFFPLGGRPYLVVVAPAGTFERGRLRAFLAGGGQGVNYRAGVWHHYALALHEPGDFLVIGRKGPGANCTEVRLDPPVRVAVDGAVP